MKLQRTYQLDIQGNARPVPFLEAADEALTIAYPLTLDLEIIRNTLASANTGRFTIYNLAPATRRAIFKDRYDILNYRGVQLKAGYQTDSTLPVIFRGNLVVAGSKRAGPNWITELECFDGGFGMINGQSSFTKPKDYTPEDLISSIVAGMPNVSLNAVGSIQVTSSRGITIVGNAWDAVQRLTQGGFAFVDLERVNVLAENEYIIVDGVIPLISAATGLLNAPRRQNALLEIDMMFEPRAVVGQIVQLQSLEAVNNGFYQVRGIRHSGRISEAFDGGVITTLSLWVGTSRLTGVSPRLVPSARAVAA